MFVALMAPSRSLFLPIRANKFVRSIISQPSP
jgi:hypothetical protein